MAIAYKMKRKAKSEPKAQSTSMTAPDKLLLLFTVVNRNKADFYVDLLQHYEVNVQMLLSASGTADSNIKSLMGLTDSEKTVIISVIRRDKSKAALAMLDEKFKSVKGGKGIAYTVPMSSTIGVAIYQFLSNNNGGGLI